MSRSLSAAGAAVLIAGPTVLAFFSGGFFDDPRLMAAVVAWALVGLAALVARRPLPRTASGRCALGALALLAAWTALSLTWAPLGTRAEDDVQRILLYLGAFTAAVALFDQPWVRRGLEPLLALGALVVTGYGLVERLLPGLVELDRSRTSDGRLEQPVTYWNAEGAIAALGLVLAVRVAGDPRRPRAIRCVAAAGGVILALTTYLSFSRGALAAVGAGLLLLLALAPDGRAQARAVLVVAVGGALASLVASGLDTITSLARGDEGDPGQGLLMLGALVVLCGSAALLAVRRRAAEPAGRDGSKLPVSRGRLIGGVALVAVVGAVLAVALLEGTPRTVSPESGTDPSRLASADSNRYRYWEVAIDMVGDDPLAGAGAGAFVVEWRKIDDRVDQAADAHSLYLETAAELGLAGLALLLVFFGGVVMCGVRLGRGDPAAVAGLAAGGLAWAVHAGLDWDWEMPAVTLPALLLAGAAVAWSEQPEPAPRQRNEPGGARPAASNGEVEVTPGAKAIW